MAMHGLSIDSSSLLGFEVNGPDEVLEAVEMLPCDTWLDVEFDEEFKALKEPRRRFAEKASVFHHDLSRTLRVECKVPTTIPPPSASWMPLSKLYMSIHRVKLTLVFSIWWTTPLFVGGAI